MHNARNCSALVAIVIACLAGCLAASNPFPLEPAASASQQGTADGLDRTVLPIPEPSYPPITELDVRNAKAPPRFEVKAPAGAPTCSSC